MFQLFIFLVCLYIVIWFLRGGWLTVVSSIVNLFLGIGLAVRPYCGLWALLSFCGFGSSSSEAAFVSFVISFSLYLCIPRIVKRLLRNEVIATIVDVLD